MRITAVWTQPCVESAVIASCLFRGPVPDVISEIFLSYPLDDVPGLLELFLVVVLIEVLALDNVLRLRPVILLGFLPGFL